MAAWALLALGQLASPRSWEAGPGVASSQQLGGQRSWFSQIFSQPHPNIIRARVEPFLASWGSCFHCMLFRNSQQSCGEQFLAMTLDLSRGLYTSGLPCLHPGFTHPLTALCSPLAPEQHLVLSFKGISSVMPFLFPLRGPEPCFSPSKHQK